MRNKKGQTARLWPFTWREKNNNKNKPSDK